MSKRKTNSKTTKVSRKDSSIDKFNNDDQPVGNGNTVSKWKAQSEQLRLAMKVTSKGGLSEAEQIKMNKAVEAADTRKQCC